LIRDCYRAIQAHVTATLLEAGYDDLRLAHANALQFVDAEGSRVQSMATRAQVTWQAMGELVSDLERLGYLTRIRDHSDRRARLVCLTDRGRALIPIVIASMREIEDEWAGRVGQSALDNLRTTLQQLWLSGESGDGKGSEDGTARRR
jgi:DNA-binding MarR family transcriptional regulator